MAEKAAAQAIMRSPLGRVRGLGSSRSGTKLWWAQRLTAFALIPLSLWFVCAIIRLAGLPRSAVQVWASSPLVATLLIALIAATFHHLQLGLQVVIEDYVHGPAKLASLLVVKGAAVLLALVAIISVLKLAIGM
jgi:succinate dehydrogenase / fumarate reductase membrane anchor subunit